MQQVFLGAAARTRHACLEVDQNSVQINHACLDQRAKCKLASGGIATCAGNQAGFANVVAVKFGQAVDRFGLQVGLGVGLAVPFLIFSRVAQTEICRQIDNL